MEKKTLGLIQKNIIQNINKVFGQKNNSLFAVDFMYAANIKIELVNSNKIKIHTLSGKFNKKNIRFGSYVDKEQNIVFVFIYSKKSELERLEKYMDDNDSKIYLTFLYLMEVIRVTKGHTTYEFAKKYNALSEENYKRLLVASYDFSSRIAYTMMSNVYKKNELKQILEYINSNANREPKPLRMLLNELKNCEIVDDSFISGHSIKNFIYYKIKYDDESYTKFTDKVTRIESIIKNKDYIANNGKGNIEIFKKNIQQVASKSDWLNNFKKKIANFSFETTDDMSVNWSGFNNMYFEIFKAPRKQSVINMIDAVISIDQSGSILDEDIGKFFYSFMKHKNIFRNIVFLFHDTIISKEIIVSSDSISVDALYSDIVKRYCNGGTSHIDVFRYLSEYIDDNKDIDNLLYVSFSDNVSDIDKAMIKYKKTEKIHKIFVRPEKSNIEILGSSCENFVV